MNINDDVIREWFYRLPKGYAEAPYSESELFVLADVIAEHDSNVGKPIPEAVELVTEEEPEDPNAIVGNEIPETSLNILIKAFSGVSERYSKYLTIFHYFDPKSLGTISEVLLARLLNEQPKIEASHEGGSGGLADLKVNGVDISLKTTSGKKRIGLMSDRLRVKAGDIKAVGNALNKTSYAPKPATDKSWILPVPIKDLGKIGDTPEEKARAKELKPILVQVNDRIEAIATKLAGPDDNDMFVWVEKKFTTIDGTDVLSGLEVHVRDYNRKDVIKELKSGKINVTKSGNWGIVPANGNVALVSAESGQMALNITPNFVKRVTVPENPILIKFPIQNLASGKKPEFDDKTFAALDNLYNQLVAGKILEPISTKG